MFYKNLIYYTDFFMYFKGIKSVASMHKSQKKKKKKKKRKRKRSKLKELRNHNGKLFFCLPQKLAEAQPARKINVYFGN